ncbi:glycoside hydrolase family 97 protein [Epilithonimonas xixisoli]|uniref:Glycosyl hydrolase family 97 n=1 Tax=Epilithonimonas xixisoli TaxID=1476462 RepID=A0A4R8IIU3_9FLAO|nr:glycoside hydrolase family 97 protein [Epilithonimonas xixisoli]TDX86873.1 glycosyl hydrolase family 97 [Epilithonimonas xixisoli]
MNITKLSKDFAVLLFFSISLNAFAQQAEISSPDKLLKVKVSLENQELIYSVFYENRVVLENSPLGLTTNAGDFTNKMSWKDSKTSSENKTYKNQKIKKSEVNYSANVLEVETQNNENKILKLRFQVSNNDIAFRYEIPSWKDKLSLVVLSEKTGYTFPKQTTTFLSPMMPAMTGFGNSAPSYESGYEADATLGKISKNKEGYVFPALFHIGKDWAMISETGVSSLYCASHLSEANGNTYNIAYPDPKQNNGFGTSGSAISLPGVTPWRTITVGNSLKPIVETTIPFDVVEPLYEASQNYQFGKSSWSWIIWQDPSMNYEDQVKFIDLASQMKFEYILVDSLWDTNIGKERFKDLIAYAKSKSVDILLWYNSNGSANDSPMGPRNKMNTAIERKKEMKWLKEVGVKGLKVDFFGGDKQETIRLYEDILSDANDYGLSVIFHGSTLPRGWEVMYPNFVGSEAVLASEMLVFDQNVRNSESFYASLHPFMRNSVGSMEFGGVVLNKYLTKSNTEKNKRLTTDAFQLATSVLFQNPIQVFAITPNNLTDVPAFELDFLKKVPTTWDETVFIDGYPGKYVVLARRHKDQWFVSGVNAEKKSIKLKLNLNMLKSKKMDLIFDSKNNETQTKSIKISDKGEFEVEIPNNGGFVIH